MKELLATIESFFLFGMVLLSSVKIMDKKLNVRLCLLLSALIYCPLLISGFIFPREIFLVIYAISHPFQILAAKFSCKNLKLISVLGEYMMIYCIELILMITVSCIVRLEGYAYTYTEFAVYLIMLAIACVCCFNTKVSSFIKSILSSVPPKIKIFTVISLVISSCVTSLMASNPLLDEFSLWGIAMRLSLIFLAVFLCSIFPVLLITTLTNSHLRHQNELFERALQAQAEHYSALARSNYELRRFRHDFKNIKIGLTKCLQDNDNDSALEILQNGENNLYSAADLAKYDSGNGIVDAILAEKQLHAEKINASIIFNGFVSQSLSPVDLCVIFGNTIDNALDACEKMPRELKKEITVLSQCNSGFCFISISNPVLENAVIKNNTLKTTKTDRSLHGYGLYSLQKTAKKYDGEVKLTCEDKIFKVDIDLCIAK